MEIWEDDDGNTESQHSCKYGVRVVYYEIINDKIRLLFCFSVGGGGNADKIQTYELTYPAWFAFCFLLFALLLFRFFAFLHFDMDW